MVFHDWLIVKVNLHKYTATTSTLTVLFSEKTNSWEDTFYGNLPCLKKNADSRFYIKAKLLNVGSVAFSSEWHTMVSAFFQKFWLLGLLTKTRHMVTWLIIDRLRSMIEIDNLRETEFAILFSIQ